MPSAYLMPDDYAAYGVASSTTDAQITQASTMIDTYLNRPEGLIYVVDGNQNPCYMKTLLPNPSPSLVLVGDIDPGPSDNPNVTATVSGPVNQVQMGCSAVIDRANPEITEAITINVVTGNQIQIQQLQFAHEDGALIEFGLCIVEERMLPKDRMVTNLTRTPVVNLLAGLGQYGYARRGSTNGFLLNEIINLIAISSPGGPPIWTPWLPDMQYVDSDTGVLWVPIGTVLYGAYYTKVRTYYIAGWTYDTLPPPIKQACANIINNILNLPAPGPIRMAKQGDTQITRFGDTYIDGDTKQMLKPYLPRLYT